MEQIDYSSMCWVYRGFLIEGCKVFMSKGTILQRHPTLNDIAYNINKNRWVSIDVKGGVI